jgi:conjugal transfer pilus assembly protein TraA
VRAREPSTPPANLTALETPLNGSLRLTSHAPARLATVAPVALLLALGATSAFAGTTGSEFQTMYTTMLNWATGYLGKAIAVAAFILGAGIGVARSSPIPALAGVVFALFMVYVPTIIDSIMTATI